MNSKDEEIIHRLVNSLLYFTQIFFYLRTGRKFELSNPLGRETHFISICRALTKVYDGKIKNLIINVPPRYAKTELAIHFVAWVLAQYPDSNFLYTSYSHSLAKKQTQTIRNIISMPEFSNLFNVKIKSDSSAKDNFETNRGGSVYAAGAGGSITGRGAGIKGTNRFGGAIIIDDIHKPDEVTSDTIREGINDWYYNTLQSRVNSPDTPIIIIGQRLHEDDLIGNLIKTGEYETLILPALDEAGNALYPEMHNLATLLKMKEEMPYTFASQYQQNPQPAGGGIFKPEWFVIHDIEPDIITTFFTVDTAETDKDYNDASVFSFWGIYKIKYGEIETSMFGLHWIDCLQLRVESKDLEDVFMNFYSKSMQHHVKPSIAGIERKSTGVTLASILSKYQGLQVIDIPRTKASGNKTVRFIEAQPYVAAHRISLPANAVHTEMCIEHCRKITANNSHAFDDIADTLYDAIKLALIDKTITNKIANPRDYTKIARQFNSRVDRIDSARKSAYRR